MINSISITWHIEDVLSRDDELTNNQARDVLESVKNNHDAHIDIIKGRKR